MTRAVAQPDDGGGLRRFGIGLERCHQMIGAIEVVLAERHDARRKARIVRWVAAMKLQQRVGPR
jgi:hypothetical protein